MENLLSRLIIVFILLFLIEERNCFCAYAVSNMESHQSSTSIKKVVVIGGTHGNEYTGVWCIKSLDADRHNLMKDFPSLKVSTLLGNPEAFTRNKRFVDTDLNREFSGAKLKLHEDETYENKLETLRAIELNRILGPKFMNAEEDHSTDLIVDLHSTTSNMGTTVIIPEGDVLMARAAAYVMHKCNAMGNKAQILMHSIPDRSKRPNLASIAKHGFTIEVGPVPQGVLRHDAVEKTQMALNALLEFLHEQNDALQNSQNGNTFDAILQKAYPSGRVPCYLSASAKRKGEMSGKLIWDSDPENPNFPLYMVHKSVQDRDFGIIKTGDPLFVKHDGTTIPYSGSHGDEIRLIFVNEGGYYYKSSGTGISVALKAEYQLENGVLLKQQESVETN